MDAQVWTAVGIRHGKGTTAYRDGNHDNILAVDTAQFLGAPRQMTRATTAIAVVPWAKFEH